MVCPPILLMCVTEQTAVVRGEERVAESHRRDDRERGLTQGGEHGVLGLVHVHDWGGVGVGGSNGRETKDLVKITG